VVQCTASGIETEPLETGLDLGEAGDVETDDLLGEAEMEFLDKEKGDYSGTKKKLEGEIKKVRADLKKKKATAKKEYDAQMKKYSKTFVKLYSPLAGKHKEGLESPLGKDGMGGMSEMSRWAYARQIASWTERARHKVAELEMKLEENRYQHFSTGVCQEVLKSKVHAIGDLQYEAKKKKIEAKMKRLRVALKRKMAYDRADMQHKLASYQLWGSDQHTAADGGFLGADDPKKTRMMSEGGLSKTMAGQMGELTQAAHWAYAQQRTHNYEVYATKIKKAKKEMAKITKQHDLTLCRTGRKPQSPELKYRLKQAKKALKGEINKLPTAEKKKAEAKEEKKKVEKAKKEEKKAKKDVKKEKAKKGGKELGENAASTVVDRDLHMKNRLIMEFHKLIDASGGQESLDERANMWERLQHDEAQKEMRLRQKYSVEEQT